MIRIVLLAALLSACGSEPCVPSTRCDGQRFVVCQDDAPVVVDCAARFQACQVLVAGPACFSPVYPPTQ